MKDREELLEFNQHLEGRGVDVLGVADHGVSHSICFFDPSGDRIELACPDTDEEAQMKILEAMRWDMLKEWSNAGRVPQRAAFLHDRASKQG